VVEGVVVAGVGDRDFDASAEKVLEVRLIFNSDHVYKSIILIKSKFESREINVGIGRKFSLS